MATAISNSFGFTALPITISDVSASSVTSTAATITVSSNSTGGTVYVSIKTSGPYSEADITGIKSGIGSVWHGEGESLTFDAVNLSPGLDHFIGVVQEFDVSRSNVHVTGTFKANSLPQEQLAPYQPTPYPNLLQYRDVPVHTSFSYGWGGDQPRTYAINKLPAGVTMDSAGDLSGSPAEVIILTGVVVTATNSTASTASAPFTWAVDRLTGTVAPSDGEVAGMTRAGLFESTTQYAERADADVDAMLPTMLLRAEAIITREIQTRQMEARYITATMDKLEEYQLPDDYNGVRTIKITYTNGTTETPELVTPDMLNRRSHNQSVMPRQYAITNNRLRFVPGPPEGGVVELIYYQGVPALTDDDSTNWLLTRWPDVYHDAMMREVSIFAKDIESANTWHTEMMRALDSVGKRDKDERWQNSRLRVRLGNTGGNDAT